MTAVTERVHTFCRLCEAGCGMVATVEDGRLVQVRPDKEHPITQGFACKNGLRAVDVHHDPDRVLRPQQRVNGPDGTGFVDVSWDDALAGVAGRLNAIIAEHGPRAVGVYLGNPNAFNALVSAAAMTLVSSLGSDRMFSAVTQDCANKYPVSELVYGSLSAQPIPDLQHTDFLMLIGTNPRVSKSSFMCVADPVAALREVRDRGARVVFVDPLNVEPDVGEAVQLHPDTDPYLLAAMLHEIHSTVGFRLGAFEGRVEGLDEVAAFVAPYSPEAVADIVGIPAERIRELAQALAAAPSAAIHASTGLNMGRQGALAYWLVQMLLLCTGNLDAPGGSYFAARAFPHTPGIVDRTTASFQDTKWGPIRRPVGMLPCALLPELIADPDEPLRALIVVAGNPVLTVGGGERLAGAFADLELLVTLDLYRNATGELADYVLPATDQFEREDLNTFVQGVQVRPSMQWTPRVCAPEGDAREEWQICADLVTAMGREPAFPTTIEDPLAVMYDGQLAHRGLSVDAIRDAGGTVEFDEPGPGGSLDRLGLTGPIVCAPDALQSTFARCHAIFAELRAEADDEAGSANRFRMITRRTIGTINTWMHNLPAGEEDAAGNPLWMHPDDGARLGLVAGATATIRNDRATLEAPVRFDARLRHGVVAMTHGFGNASTTGMRNAQKRAGVNVNALAPSGPEAFDPVSCMQQVTGIPVEVAAG
jgi:anaerobic selenocysteine-containing dehydrogenase